MIEALPDYLIAPTAPPDPKWRPCVLGDELAANPNRNVMASMKARGPPGPWPIITHGDRTLAVSPDSTDLRERRGQSWHYVDSKRALDRLRAMHAIGWYDE